MKSGLVRISKEELSVVLGLRVDAVFQDARDQEDDSVTIRVRGVGEDVCRGRIPYYDLRWLQEYAKRANSEPLPPLNMGAQLVGWQL